MIRTLSLVLGLCLLLAGIAVAQETPPAETPEPQTARELELVGAARLVGSGNFPVLLFAAENGERFSLGGPLFTELTRIENIKIRIWAVREGTKQDHPHLAVVRYEILDVGKGVKPFVGRVIVQDDKLVLSLLDSPKEYTLTGNSKVLAMLRKVAGGRVWIAGEVQEGNTLRIRKYGILTKSGD